MARSIWSGYITFGLVATLRASVEEARAGRRKRAGGKKGRRKRAA